MYARDPRFRDTGVGIELDTDLYYSAVSGLVGNGITFGVDLLEGFLCGAISFQLKDVDRIGHPDYHIGPAASTADLGTGIDVKHGEDEIHGIFIEAFSRGSICKLLLESLHVGDAGHV